MTSIPKTSGLGSPSCNTLRSRSCWAGGSSDENKVSGTGGCWMAIPVSPVNSRNSRSALGNSSGCNHHAPRKVTVTGAGAGLRQSETMQKSRTMTKGNVICNRRCDDTRMFMKIFLKRSRFSGEFQQTQTFFCTEIQGRNILLLQCRDMNVRKEHAWDWYQARRGK